MLLRFPLSDSFGKPLRHNDLRPNRAVPAGGLAHTIANKCQRRKPFASKDLRCESAGISYK